MAIRKAIMTATVTSVTEYHSYATVKFSTLRIAPEGMVQTHTESDFWVDVTLAERARFRPGDSYEIFLEERTLQGR